MPIRLSWTDENPGQNTRHWIYRDEAPMDSGALPEPFVKLGKVTEYLDDTAVDGSTYYYRVAAVAEGEVQVSSEVSLIAE